MDPETLPGALAEPDSSNPEGLEELRHKRIFYDGVTGLPIHPFETPERLDERIEHLSREGEKGTRVTVE